MTHLGDRVAALVDGQLSPESCEQATVHVVSCSDCFQAVERERLTKARLVRLPAPSPDPELIHRLLLIGGSGPQLPQAKVRPGVVASGRGIPHHGAPAARSAHPGPSGRPGSSRRVGRTRRRLTTAVIGTMSLIGAGVVGLRAPEPAVVPPVARFVTEHSATTDPLPFGGGPTLVPVVDPVTGR
ncbi:MAG: hypothetical protein GXX79_00670 [Actinomycetales bacterium]|nr:hypothetical protein [Actinomycetales bacterium]